jgi:superoxide reductase
MRDVGPATDQATPKPTLSVSCVRKLLSMDSTRRQFLSRLASTPAAGFTAGAIVVPSMALVFTADQAAAAEVNPLTGKLAGALYYTKERTGRWNTETAKFHLPTFSRRKNALQLRTNHPMKGYRHYILKHILFDQNFRMIGEQLFTPDKDWPVSSWDVSGLEKRVYALSVCNLHDAWLASFTV